jgi:putative DNA primase/helicase
LPPDPDLLLTKWTPTNYDRDATHADWQAALSALPADAVDWLQMRFGQAITGHTPPDDELVFLHGSGENGKTTLTLGVSKALGDHATAVPERLLLANPSDHPTELMTLRGARLAMIEELPEGRYISVSRLKNVVGKPIMKARAVHRDNVEWDATHSLFVSSNYRMLVNETDHGTWRRLLLLPFPYTYRKEHEELKGERDRRGDAGLRDRIRRSRDRQHEAILRWLVDGAVRWYANDQKMGPPPESVAEATRLWRDNCDDIAKFWSDALEAAPGRYVSSREMITVFNDCLKEMGQKPWADRTFAERFGSHDETTNHRVYADRVYPAKSDLRASRPPLTNLGMSKGLPERLRVWVGVKFKQEYERSEGGGEQVK